MTYSGGVFVVSSGAVASGGAIYGGIDIPMKGGRESGLTL